MKKKISHVVSFLSCVAVREFDTGNKVLVQLLTSHRDGPVSFQEIVKLYDGETIQLEECIREKVEVLENKNKCKTFVLLDVGEIYRKLENWRHLLPRVEPFYALKCNHHPLVAKVLADAGIGFDCASKKEIKQILKLGVDPKRIIYANTCKQKSYITYAGSKNVDLMTFDGVHELIKIKDLFPDARLILRIQSNERHKAKHNFNTKCGCHRNHSKELLAQAWEMKLNVVGISFHVGSLPDDAECFASTIADAHFVFQIGQSLGFNMTILDIGGGFPGIDDDGGKFEKIADVVNKSIDLYFPASQGVRIIAEPGRYLITSAVTLAVNIIGKRIVRQNFKKKNQNGTTHLSLSPLNCNASHDKGRDSKMTHDIRRTDDDIRNNESLVYMYYVNDGVYGTLANVMTDSVVIQHKVLYREAQPDADASPKKPSIIWGPSCDSLDCVVPDCNLPDLKVGEWLYFCNMGAYTLCLATDFNGIERPLVFPVCSKHYWNQMYPEGSPMLYLPYV